MAQNFRKDGKTIKWTNGTGSTVNSGDPVVIGGKVYVALEKILDTGVGILKSDGVYEWPKDTPLVINQGDKVFWSGTEVTKTVTDTFLGTAHEAAASADTTVLVDIGPGTAGTQAAVVAFAAGANLVGVDGAGSNAAPLAGTETRLDALETALLALIAALKASGQMAGD